MKRTTVLAYGATLGFLSFITAAVAIAGCSSSDDDQKTQPQRLSQKNEACLTSNDCAEGLACRPRSGGGGVCVVSVFNIAPTAKECAITQCTQKSECCPTKSRSSGISCDELLRLCGDAGPSSSACFDYDSNCKCDKWDCVKERCQQQQCTTDSECSLSSSNAHCSAGQCVECIEDTHCTGGEVCVSGACQPACTADSDCPDFDRCQAGKCVSSGCLTDRECVAATKNVEATCGTDKKCVIPCETDLDCGSPNAYDFVSCIDHKCIDVGCSSDKDCECANTTPNTPGTSEKCVPYSPPSSGAPAKPKYVCRDRKTAQ